MRSSTVTCVSLAFSNARTNNTNQAYELYSPGTVVLICHGHPVYYHQHAGPMPLQHLPLHFLPQATRTCCLIRVQLITPAMICVKSLGHIDFRTFPSARALVNGSELAAIAFILLDIFTIFRSYRIPGLRFEDDNWYGARWRRCGCEAGGASIDTHC
jgi:hypothetical protein